MSREVLTTIDVHGLEKVSSGKVREIFALDDTLLLVASDRLSAFDVVFPNGIPGKGKILTRLSSFWFEKTSHIIDNHFITTDIHAFPDPARGRTELEGRATLCRRAQTVPVECIVRGYLDGSAWKAYQATGEICGRHLPEGLQRRSPLPEPIFTPSTKAEHGQHDENITFDQCCDIVGRDIAERLQDASLAIFEYAREYLDQRGITLADTKFEFGLLNDKLILIDELLTPDSSRFWVKGSFEEGGEPISYDKQYVRDYLETTDWAKTPPAPPLPEEVVTNTSRRYIEICEKITGEHIER